MQERELKKNRGHLRRLLTGYLLSLLVFCGLFMYVNRTKKIKVEFEINTSAPCRPQLFYLGSNGRFSPNRVIDFPVIPANQWYRATAFLKTPYSLQKLRLSPVDGYGLVTIRYFRVTGVGDSQTWNGFDVLKCGFDNIQSINNSAESIAVFHSTGKNPSIIFDISPRVFRRPFVLLLKDFAMANLYSILLFGFIQGILSLSRIPVLRNSVHKSLNKLAEFLSDKRTIVFNARSVSVLAIAGIMVMLFVTFKLNQSSIGLWDKIYGEPSSELFSRIGSPKNIRSDEWITQTPWLLNQVQRGMMVENKNIGGAQSAFMAATPVRHQLMLFQPKFWGFLFLDLERGFSWIWAYKAFGLFISFYLLFLLLTGGDGLISASGALWVYGSSFVQWWYSSHLPEQLIGFALAVLGAIYLLQAEKVRSKLFGGVLVAFSIVNLLLHVYPPFLVPLGYLGVFTVVAFNLQNSRLRNIAADWKPVLLISTLVVAVSASFIYSWAITGRETIELMMNTSYPGKRIELGGNMPLPRICYGIFECLRDSQYIYPIEPSNSCEASSFVLLFPLLLFMIRPSDRYAVEAPLLSGLFLYCLFVLAWMIFPMPLWLREGFAAIGWLFSPAYRSQVGIGIGSIMLVTVFASMRARHKVNYSKISTIILMASIAVVILLTGFWLKGIDPKYFDNIRIFVGLLLAEGIVLSIVIANRRYFHLAITLLVLPSLTVNPIQYGLASVLNKPVLNMAVLHGGQVGDRWAVIGDYGFAQGLKARGLDVINGSNYAPNLLRLRALDPDGRFKNIWNRYAHISIASSPGIKHPEFSLLGPDHYLLTVDICSDQFRSLGVTHLAYTKKPTEKELRCLLPLKTDFQSKVYLYKYTMEAR